MIAIGDIHGCCRTAEALLEKLESFPDRKLIFIGDYIDRGPCSREVVDLMLDLEKSRDCVFLRGNHEQMLLDALEQEDRGHYMIWMNNGGMQTLHSYEISSKQPGVSEIPSDHLDFYRRTQFYYTTEEYFFVHAGLSPERLIAESIEDPSCRHQFLWSRDHLNVLEPVWEKKVVFGHTVRPEPIRRPEMIGIDTGCVYDGPGYGRLTAVVLPEEQFVHQENVD